MPVSTSHSLVPFAPDSQGRETWLRHLESVELAASTVLFRQGDPSDCLYFVEQGELAVVLEVPGAGRVPVRRFGPGQCIGEIALYRNETRSATVEALAPSRLWRLTSAQLLVIEKAEPALALAMHRHVAGLLAERLTYSNTELKDPLARLVHAIRGLAASNFGESDWDRTAVAAASRRPDEVGAVAGALEHLVARLHTYLDELRAATTQREAIESELRIAGKIQASFLPPELPADQRARVDFASRSKPAREAGGDLYDGFLLDDGRFFFVVGDVSGKGVSAALFMAVTSTAIRALATGARPPGELLTLVNRLLCERNDTLQFVTVFAAIFDPATGELAWTNCGHPSPFLLRADGTLSTLQALRATPVAVFEDHTYATHHTTLALGDTLILYTDGVNEAMDPDGGFYGDARLHTLLDGKRFPSADDAVATVLADVLAFEASAPQADDITVVGLRRI
ncbi:MAG: SpoIIE family protein phosphatase [Opitutaceae bacterium]|nr:SpoIIE family protein phosphatase [Opitutaceae bacterium]